MFRLTRSSEVPLVEQIVERIVTLIRDGQLAEGSRIPSIRKLAAVIEASPYTVADAYDRLVARGLIESRAGRGFFVARRYGTRALPLIEALPDPAGDAVALARATLSQPAQIIPAGSGFLPASWYAEALPARAVSRLSRTRKPQAWMPCPPQGIPELREQISARLVQRGIAAGPDNIVTTYGASQAFDLLGRILLSPGDAVLVEDPGYFVLFEQLRAHHVRLIPVPRRPDGPDTQAIEDACRAHRPRAFFVQTLLHNPTGSNADPSVCHRLLSLAEQFGFALIEDDVYGDLYEGPAVRLAQLDGLRHVVYVGSFTKIIGPTTRLGFVAADAALVAQLVERKLLSVLSGSALLESVVSEALDSGSFRRYCQLTRARLVRLQRDARASLEASGVEFPEPSTEGIFLWGRLPAGTDAEDLVRRARERSILLARGALFSPSQRCNDWLRFNATCSAAPELRQFLSETLRAA